MKVLITVDGSEYSKTAIDAVINRAWEPDDQFVVLTVADDLPKEFSFLRDGQEPDSVASALVQQYESYVDEAVQKLQSGLPEHFVEAAVARGPIAQTIANCARTWGIDLIVMASNGRKGF